MPAALRLASVQQRYRHQPALRDLSFELATGAATALLGVNGAGKSTLIRAVLDLVRIDAGRIEIFGVDHRMPAARAPLAYLGERFLPPHAARGREVLELLCRLHGVPFDRQRAGAECVALQLEPAMLERPAREYSKGMLQKLGLVACLLAGRPLLLLDEPMSGLDPVAHALIRDRLRALHDAGTTLLFSTHALGDLAAICDRVLVLHEGALVFDDTTARFLARDPHGNPERALLGVLAA